MLDIALRELMGCAQKQVLAHESRSGMNEGHHILQLISKSESAPDW